jgi:hypothetical protein
LHTLETSITTPFLAVVGGSTLLSMGKEGGEPASILSFLCLFLDFQRTILKDSTITTTIIIEINMSVFIPSPMILGKEDSVKPMPPP